MIRQAAVLAELPCDHSRYAADLRRSARRATGLPTAPDGVGGVEAFHSVKEVAHEIVAAQFAVGGEVETDLLLPGDHAAHVQVFQSMQLGQRLSIAGMLRDALSRFENRSGPKQAA